jgi:MoxR-like ATPase
MSKLKMVPIQELRVALNKQFLERSELIDGMLVALMSGDPLLLLGPPGVGKSMLCQAICSAISGDYFSWCLNKLTTPEEIFGPISLKALEQDKYMRLTTGKLPTASIAFMDEIFKSSSAILNTMLTILNEKVYHNDGKAQKIPLKVLYAASNEVPQAEELAAMFDRFVLKYYVDPVREDTSASTLFTGLENVTMPKVALADLDAIQVCVARPLKEDVQPVLTSLMTIRRAIADEGIQVSDRKWVQSVRILKANSLLNEHDTIEEEDLEILTHVLWSSVEQKAKVRKIVNKVCNPVGEKILEVTDAAREIYEGIGKNQVDAIEGFKKIKHAVKELEKLGDSGKNSKLKHAIEQTKIMQQQIATTHLGLDS